MAKTSKSELQKTSELENATACYRDRFDRLTLARRSYEEQAAPLRAAFERSFAAALNVQANLVAECESELAAAENELRAVMERHAVQIHESLGVKAKFSQATMRHISPSDLLKFAEERGDRVGGLACLSVILGEADNRFGKQALSPITAVIDNGKPKFSVSVSVTPA